MSYPPQPGPPPYSQAPMPPEAPAKGFFGSLFDVSFHSFVTPKIIKGVYLIAMVLIGVTVIAFIVAGFAMMAHEPATGLLFVLAAPVLGLVYLILARISLEGMYAMIRLSEDVHHGRGRM